MTTRELFLTINQIYLNKQLLQSLSENYNITISSHDNYYHITYHKEEGTQINLRLEVEHSPITHSKYYLNWRFSNLKNKIVQSNNTTTNEKIPKLVENLFLPLIREMKINQIISNEKTKIKSK